MSGVYENMFQTSEISIFPSLSNELLFTLCLRSPSNSVTQRSAEYKFLYFVAQMINYEILIIQYSVIPFTKHFLSWLNK